MNYNIINSGSDGNAVIVNNAILIDCGVSFKKLQKYYIQLKLVLLTHIHLDHFNSTTIKKLAELKPLLRFGCCEWLLDELLKLGISRTRIDVYDFDTGYCYNNSLSIEPFELYHDVPQCGYKVFINDRKLIYATDTNKIEHIEAKDYNLYLIEANYENEEELHNRAYNLEYEKRVKETHLSKEQATEWLLKNMGNNSFYEFMHQHKEKPLAKRFEMLKPLLNKASEVTMTEYELSDDGIYSCIEELINAYEHKVEEINQLEQDIYDNYRPLTKAEQYE